jgi:hypothetical protein
MYCQGPDPRRGSATVMAWWEPIKLKCDALSLIATSQFDFFLNVVTVYTGQV